jgi:hypothetical protein
LHGSYCSFTIRSNTWNGDSVNAYIQYPGPAGTAVNALPVCTRYSQIHPTLNLAPASAQTVAKSRLSVIVNENVALSESEEFKALKALTLFGRAP